MDCGGHRSWNCNHFPISWLYSDFEFGFSRKNTSQSYNVLSKSSISNVNPIVDDCGRLTWKILGWWAHSDLEFGYSGQKYVGVHSCMFCSRAFFCFFGPVILKRWIGREYSAGKVWSFTNTHFFLQNMAVSGVELLVDIHFLTRNYF